MRNKYWYWNEMKSVLLAGCIIIAISLNILTFYMAYPTVVKASQDIAHDGEYAMPFSAYFEGAWRFIHNSSQVYSIKNATNDYPLTHPPQQFKYAPSFLIFILPMVLMNLSYTSSFLAFDLLQVILLPVMGFFTFALARGKGVLAGALASFVILLQPLPAIPWNDFTQATPASVIASLGYRLGSFNAQSLSWTYYWNYVHGQAHVLQLFLLIAAMYAGFKGKPTVSAVFAVLGAFDPRMFILALPLLVYYNKEHVKGFIRGVILAAFFTLVPFFIYGIGDEFIYAVLTRGLRTPINTEVWIPIYGIIFLTLVEYHHWVTSKAAPQPSI